MKQKLKKRIGLILCISILFNILLPLLNLFSGQVLAKDDKDGKKLAQYIGEFLREIWISKLTEFDNSELDKEDATVEFTLYGLDKSSKENEGDGGEDTSDENFDFSSFNGEFIWPAPGYKKITSPFGPRTYTLNGKRVSSDHKGIDIGIPIGNKIVASADGKVVTSSYNTGGYGNYIIIDHR